MTDTILWILLIISAMSGVISLAAKAIMGKPAYPKRNINSGGLGLGCLAIIIGLGALGAWTTYAITVGDWRFAAIAVTPVVIAAIGGGITSGREG